MLADYLGSARRAHNRAERRSAKVNSHKSLDSVIEQCLKALENYKNVISLNLEEETGNVHHLLARSYAVKEKWENAIHHYNIAIALKRKDRGFLFAQSARIRVFEKDYERAIRGFVYAAQANQDLKHIYLYEIGLCHLSISNVWSNETKTDMNEVYWAHEIFRDLLKSKPDFHSAIQEFSLTSVLTNQEQDLEDYYGQQNVIYGNSAKLFQDRALGIFGIKDVSKATGLQLQEARIMYVESVRFSVGGQYGTLS